jgi:hypothetical protein
MPDIRIITVLLIDMWWNQVGDDTVGYYIIDLELVMKYICINFSTTSLEWWELPRWIITHVYEVDRIIYVTMESMEVYLQSYGGGSKPIIINSNGMNIHLPAILGFTRCQGFDQ